MSNIVEQIAQKFERDGWLQQKNPDFLILSSEAWNELRKATDVGFSLLVLGEHITTYMGMTISILPYHTGFYLETGYKA